MIEPYVQPGVTTEELDKRCHDFIVDELKSIPANLNYRGFPKTICTSVNHVVCHGIPGDKRLKAGDIINIDVTVIRDGFHGDTSRMYLVGNAAILARRLTAACHEAMWCGIRMVKPGAPTRSGRGRYMINGSAWSLSVGCCCVLRFCCVCDQAPALPQYPALHAAVVFGVAGRLRHAAATFKLTCVWIQHF